MVLILDQTLRFELPLDLNWYPFQKRIQMLERNYSKHGLGYHDLHNCLPFLPIRDVPQGSTPRKHEVGRDRRTSDGGFPRKPACDNAGICAVSLNNAIGLHPVYSTPDGDQPK